MNKPRMVIIGSSGAGLPILTSIFKNMPRLHGAIVLIQHMPFYINQTVCDNLAAITQMTVKIADQDERLKYGNLYIAPSELHLMILQNERIRLFGGEKVNYVCPSIDVAMMSLKSDPGLQPMGILLSGVGSDGVKGISHIKRLGGVTMVLDKNASPISGMADEALATGDVDYVLSPEQIREKMREHLGLDRSNTESKPKAAFK
jgi:two-component system chemotaxis response regulator CheB